MTLVEDLERPDLAYLSCPVCGLAFQSPRPPDFPAGYGEAIAELAEVLDGAGSSATRMNELLETIDAREEQALAYRLDEAAFEAFRRHSFEEHTAGEHLELAHSNRIPIVCDCGHEEQATPAGLTAMKEHGASCSGIVRSARHQPAYSAAEE